MFDVIRSPGDTPFGAPTPFSKQKISFLCALRANQVKRNVHRFASINEEISSSTEVDSVMLAGENHRALGNTSRAELLIIIQRGIAYSLLPLISEYEAGFVSRNRNKEVGVTLSYIPTNEFNSVISFIFPLHFSVTYN